MPATIYKENHMEETLKQLFKAGFSEKDILAYFEKKYGRFGKTYREVKHMIGKVNKGAAIK